MATANGWNTLLKQFNSFKIRKIIIKVALFARSRF